MSDKLTVTQRAIAAVQELNPTATNLQLVHTHAKFLGGQLLVVTFDNAGQGFENYVFVRRKVVRVARNMTLMVELANQETDSGPIGKAFAELLNIANIIALALTALIAYLVVAKNMTEVPAVLTTALTTIIGFYFGTKSSKSDD